VGRRVGSGHQCHVVAVGGVFEVQKEVGADTVNPSGRNLVMVDRLVLENDTGDVDGGGMQLGAGRDGVVARLETRDGGDNQIEGHVPRGGIFLRWKDGNIGTRDELQNLSELEAPVGYYPGVRLFIASQGFDPLLGSGGWGVLDESAKELSAGDGHDIDIVTENGEVGGRNRERDLGKSGIERFDADNSVLLIVKTEGVQHTVNLDIWVVRPDTNVIAVLVVDTGTLDVELHVNAASVGTSFEELTSDGDRCWVGVLGVVDTLRSCQSTSGKFTCKMFVSIYARVYE